MTPRTPARWFLLLAALVLAGFLVLPSASAEQPSVTPNPDASRSVTWAMDTVEGLSLTNVEVSQGHAELNWTSHNVTWAGGPALISNGNPDENLTWNDTGISLRGNVSDYIANGTFPGEDPWAFVSSARMNVTASWDGVAKDGVMQHRSPATEVLWNGMDSPSDIATNWAFPATGCTGGLSENTSGPVQPPGMMQIAVTGGACSYVGAVNYTWSADWSGVDRLVLMINASASASSASFNVTARVDGVPISTAAQLLLPGWQEVVVDLDKLGPAASRSNLQSVTLRFNFAALETPASFFVDDVRTAMAKVFVETASISQTFTKPNATTPLSGSGVLSFDWFVSHPTGIVSVSPVVNVSDEAGAAFSRFMLAGPTGVWNHFLGDISPATSAASEYNLSFAVTVAANDTSESEVTVRFDNASLYFPERTQGAYDSDVNFTGAKSQFLELNWCASLPPLTGVVMSLRTGNTSDGSGNGWSQLYNWSMPGRYSLSVPPNMYFQVRSVLTTTNASESPVLESVSVFTRHRVFTGVVTSSNFTANSDFLKWRTLKANWSGSAASSISFLVRVGVDWSEAVPGGTLPSSIGSTIQWQARFTTADGTQTPTLTNVTFVYEYLGPIARLTITPAGPRTAVVGDWINLTALAYDSGGHANTSGYVTWSTDDPANRVNAIDSRRGAYYAATPGAHNVTAVLLGFSATVEVTVVARSDSPPFEAIPAWLLSPAFLLPLAIAIAGGFGVYEFAIRRMFAVDDVFIISRDGRLMLHNTRRMRADRDEDVLSGMLTAMITFLRDWDPEENGRARRFDYGEKTALLEHGEHVFVAAVYAGHVPGWARKDLSRFVRDLERRFGTNFSHWTGSPQDLHGLRQFTERFVSRLRYRGNGRAS